MRFLIDECTGPAVARWLRSQQHDVFSVYEEARGIDDEGVIQRAFAENRILITNDKDFGEKIYREQKPHKGVILLRLADERPSAKVDILQRHRGCFRYTQIVLPANSSWQPKQRYALPELILPSVRNEEARH